jgi:hypothetical protein
LPGTALLRAISHHEHSKREDGKSFQRNRTYFALGGDRYGRNATLFYLENMLESKLRPG